MTTSKCHRTAVVRRSVLRPGIALVGHRRRAQVACRPQIEDRERKAENSISFWEKLKNAVRLSSVYARSTDYSTTCMYTAVL